MDGETKFFVTVIILASIALILQLRVALKIRLKNWRIRTGRAKNEQIGEPISRVPSVLECGETIDEKCPNCGGMIQFVWVSGIERAALRCTNCQSFFHALCAPHQGRIR